MKLKKVSIKPLSTKGIKTYSLKKRRSKVSVAHLASLPKKGGTVKEFMRSLPDVLGARDLRGAASAVVRARQRDKTVALGLGAHVIKVGLSPLIVDLMERGVVSSVALNGAGIVHDFELAYAGTTSEDVDSGLLTGRFGMAEETGKILNNAVKRGARKGAG